MANETSTGSLADSRQTIIDSARTTREYMGTHIRTCDTETLEEGTGLSWEEIQLGQLTAQTVSETTELNNPQTFTDSLLTATPLVSGLTYIVTDRVYRRLPKKVTGKLGPVGQEAVQRKKDEDYLSIFATAATTLAGTAQTLQSGHVASAAYRIRSNATEGAIGPINAVIHGFGIKDIRDEIVSAVGTYAIPEGMTADVFKHGLVGMTVDNVSIWEDGNIAINATPDARGGVHAKMAVLRVQGHQPRFVTKRREEIGGGAEQGFHYDEYVFVERHAGGGSSGGGWLFGLLHDATAPTN